MPLDLDLRQKLLSIFMMSMGSCSSVVGELNSAPKLSRAILKPYSFSLSILAQAGFGTKVQPEVGNLEDIILGVGAKLAGYFAHFVGKFGVEKLPFGEVNRYKQLVVGVVVLPQDMLLYHLLETPEAYPVNVARLLHYIKEAGRRQHAHRAVLPAD